MTKTGLADFLRRTGDAFAALPPIPEESAPSRRAASVLALVTEITGDVHFGLTLRARTLPNHAGEISFPGGMIQKGEGVGGAALRETHEEIGILPEVVTLHRYLPRQQTKTTRLYAYPVIGWVNPDVILALHPGEVERFFWAPLSFFRNRANENRRSELLPGESVGRPAVRYDQYEVWGLTLHIIRLIIAGLDRSMDV